MRSLFSIGLVCALAVPVSAESDGAGGAGAATADAVDHGRGGPSVARRAIPGPSVRYERNADRAKSRGSSGFRTIDLAGYVRPTFGIIYRPNGVSQDRLDYTASATQAGLVLMAEPVRNWTFHAEIIGTAETFQKVGVSGDDGGGGSGVDDNLPFTASDAKQLVSAMHVRELSLGYRPHDAVEFRIGQMRVPYTLVQQTGTTALVFAARNTFDDVFMRGSDLGALASARLWDRVVVETGVFNGSNVTDSGDNERGPLFVARTDLQPMGPLPTGSADFDRAGFRVGVGGAFLYMPGKQFSSTGFEMMRTRDLKASASLRMAWRGLSLQAEALRRQRTTSISSRPLIASGAYAQGSFFFHFSRLVAVAPIVRFGWLREGQGFDPRDVTITKAGLSMYLIGDGRLPDDVRLTIQYLGENRITEGEMAHGVVSQLQLRF